MKINTNIDILGGLSNSKRTTNSSSGTLNNVTLSDSSVIYFTDNSPVVTGLVAPTNMQIILIFFTGIGTLSFDHQSLSSTPANRIITPTGATISINPNEAISLMYDDVSSRWRVLFRP